jgi:hypothetical protein
MKRLNKFLRTAIGLAFFIVGSIIFIIGFAVMTFALWVAE